VTRMYQPRPADGFPGSSTAGLMTSAEVMRPQVELLGFQNNLTWSNCPENRAARDVAEAPPRRETRRELLGVLIVFVRSLRTIRFFSLAFPFSSH